MSQANNGVQSDGREWELRDQWEKQLSPLNGVDSVDDNTLREFHKFPL